MAERLSDHAIGGPGLRCSAILRRAGSGATGVEVGVFRGALSSALLKAGVKRLFMVDSWRPQSEQPKAYRATGDYHANLAVSDVAQDREKAMAVARRYRAAVVMNYDSSEAAQLIHDASVDFVFLDADHSYEGVIADIAAWLPKVRAGGWIGGHDYDNDHPDYDFSGVKRAVDEVFGDRVETDENFTWFVKVQT